MPMQHLTKRFRRQPKERGSRQGTSGAVGTTAAIIGMRTSTVVPAPTALAIVSSPSWAAQICRAMAKSTAGERVVQAA